MIEVERVDYVRIPVTDMEKANHFYGEVLGLARSPSSAHEGWVEYEAGNVSPPTPGPLPPPRAEFR